MKKIVKEKVKKVDLGEVFSNGVLVNLRVSKWLASMKFDPKKLNEDAPTNILRASQDLLEDKSKLEEIKSLYYRTKNYLYRNTIPTPIHGLDFVPKDKIEEINDFLTIQRDTFDGLVIEFLNDYDRLKEKFEEKYPEYYIPSKYPSKEALKSKFSFEWVFRLFVVPSNDMLSNGILKEEIKKQQKEIIEITELVGVEIRKQLIGKLESLTNQCTEGKINNKTINAIQDYLDKIDDLYNDFIGSAELKKQINIVKKYLSSDKLSSGDLLKDNDQLRQKVGDVMSSVLDNIKNQGPKRSLEF